MAEEKYTFHEDEDDENAENSLKKKVQGFLEFVWNTKTREFCGRDGASWAKVSLFYGIFYLLLGGFFIGMLAVFFAVTPRDKPTYYGISSVMNQKGLNPGLGFRPQIDPEDLIIKYNPLTHVAEDYGLEKYVSNLRIFLSSKYDDVSNENTVDCSGSVSDNSADDMACKFDYKKIYENTQCTEAKKFGYETSAPCVLIKLNKIISWQPKADKGYISIRCNGENAFDTDNINKITYYSENFTENTEEARIPTKYFPYSGQKNYQAPFVWVRVEVTPNTLVNVECKAYAENIEIERLNRRGLTKFALNIQKKNPREL